MNNKEVLICKEKILKCLVEDFKNNQAIFDKKQGFQNYDGTDLEMVMDKVVKGLKFAQSEIRTKAYVLVSRIDYTCSESFVGVKHSKAEIMELAKKENSSLPIYFDRNKKTDEIKYRIDEYFYVYES